MMTLDEVKKKYPNSKTFTLGDNEALCQELLALVKSGKKTGTCEDVRQYKNSPDEMAVVGRKDIALNWDGTPALVIETMEVNHRRFCDVDEEFALSEGEDDTLEGWQASHQRYFERNLGFFPEMELVCERFRVVEKFE